MTLINIHRPYSHIFKIRRAKRMDQFDAMVQPQSSDLVLDVG
ncbi:MAG: hypothetical protein ACKVJU_19335 [Verrucomicrobiales bacterium]